MRIQRPITLSKIQRADLDERVLSAIADGCPRQIQIAAALDAWMKGNLPKREDRFRYVDHAIGRLKKAGMIRPAKGMLGWVRTTKAIRKS